MPGEKQHRSTLLEGAYLIDLALRKQPLEAQGRNGEKGGEKKEALLNEKQLWGISMHREKEGENTIRNCKSDLGKRK